ncbi:hypothetical protein D8674_008842 [Pyrus ussuriensis x Pyrus communis]|uniref:Uncharacterized protein n=1 Tax=Pyrus ussuriensis x Pyrus communis TaxID=2448454 RepID=A0A5N5HWZ9_9ROSA|nr:hypothetical protein D8674_008842 [Pyrus ussuriensis x Pyrus communis]
MDGGKSHKNKPFDSVKAESVFNRAVVTLRKQNTSAVVMEDYDDYNLLNELIINNVWLPDFMIHEETDKAFRDALRLRTEKLGNDLRRETVKVMNKH